MVIIFLLVKTNQFPYSNSGQSFIFSSICRILELAYTHGNKESSHVTVHTSSQRDFALAHKYEVISSHGFWSGG